MPGVRKNSRQVLAFDPNLDTERVDIDELDDSSKLMEQFTRKTRKVKRIFRESSEESENNPNMSFEMRLTSKSNKNNEDPDNEPEASAILSDEPKREPEPKLPLHIRNLSPVSIVTLSSEDVSESLPQASNGDGRGIVGQFGSAKKSSTNLRRSLFMLGQTNQDTNVLVTSTPLSTYKTTRRVPFFSDMAGSAGTNLLRKFVGNTSVNGFSPIDGAVEDVEEASPPADKLDSVKILEVPSIAAFEKDLEKQYVPEKLSTLPPNSRRRCSISSQKSSVHEDELMELASIRQETLHERKRSGSTENRTDVNSLQMVETPICNRRQQQIVPSALDKELAVMLRRCDETDDASDHESSVGGKGPVQEAGLCISLETREGQDHEARVAQPEPDHIEEPSPQNTSAQTSPNSRSVVHQVATIQADVPVNVSEAIEKIVSTSTQELSQQFVKPSSPSTRETRSSSVNSMRSSKSAKSTKSVTGGFQKPRDLNRNGKTTKRPKRGESIPEKRDTIEFSSQEAESTQSSHGLNDSSSRTVPPEIIKSILSLRQTSSSNENLSEKENVSNVKIQVPARKRARSKINSMTQSYLDLTQKTSKEQEKRSIAGKKRTLYSLRSPSTSISELGPLTASSGEVDDVDNMQHEQEQEEVEVVQKKRKMNEKRGKKPVQNADKSSEESQPTEPSTDPGSEEEQEEQEVEVVQKKRKMSEKRVKKPVQNADKSSEESQPTEPSTDPGSEEEQEGEEEEQEVEVVQKKRKMNEKRGKKTSYNDDESSDESPPYEPSSDPDSEEDQEGEEEEKEVEVVQKKRKMNEKRGKKPVKSADKGSEQRQPSGANTDPDPDSQTERSKNTESDEGFDSSSTNVRYNPYDQGCTRPGLRVRRYAKPWWINSGQISDYGIVYTNLTKRHLKGEVELKKVMKKNSITEVQICRSNNLAQYMKPSEKMKVFVQSQKESEKIVASGSQAKVAESKTRVVRKTTKNSQIDVGVQPDASTSTACSTTEEFDRLGNIIQSIYDGSTFKKSVTPAVVTSGYDLANIGNLKLRDCGNGLYFGAYIENKSDGIIKLIPGGFKSKSKSKNSSLKFFVVIGKVDLIIQDECVKLGPLGYVCINPGKVYELRNTSDKDVIVYFTRFDKVMPPEP